MIGGWPFKQMGMSKASDRVTKGPTAETSPSSCICISDHFLTDSSCQGSLRGEIMTRLAYNVIKKPCFSPNRNRDRQPEAASTEIH